MPPEILTTDEAAEYLRLGKSTLEKMRVNGAGPTFIRLGARRLGYMRADLDHWLTTRPRLTNTSQVAA